jgi:hypothetical protein
MHLIQALSADLALGAKTSDGADIFGHPYLFKTSALIDRAKGCLCNRTSDRRTFAKVTIKRRRAELKLFGGQPNST